MNRGRVGEERRGKEMDGCPLTVMKVTSPLSVFLTLTQLAALMDLDI
jgi:hypothetical protein